MITNITLENFKCFRHVSINPKRLTVLIGPNGTGKSSILQALLLLKQSAGENKIRHQGEFVSLGGPEDMAPYFLPEPSTIQIGFNGNVKDADFQYSGSFTSALALTPGSSLPKPHTAPGIALQHIHPVLPSFSYSKQLRHVTRPKSSELLSEIMRKVTGTKLLGNTEGAGAKAIVPLLHQLIIADKGATVLIEEPEIHLHPKAQAELAEVLAETAKAEDKQIIMTTHSEHILSRLLTLVAEKSLSPNRLAIYSFEKDDKGECSATEIEVTELGQVTGGLTGFYDANLDEMDRYVRALQKQS